MLFSPLTFLAKKQSLHKHSFTSEHFLTIPSELSEKQINKKILTQRSKHFIIKKSTLKTEETETAEQILKNFKKMYQKKKKTTEKEEAFINFHISRNSQVKSYTLKQKKKKLLKNLTIAYQNIFPLHEKHISYEFSLKYINSNIFLSIGFEDRLLKQLFEHLNGNRFLTGQNSSENFPQNLFKKPTKEAKKVFVQLLRQEIARTNPSNELSNSCTNLLRPTIESKMIGKTSNFSIEKMNEFRRSVKQSPKKSLAKRSILKKSRIESESKEVMIKGLVDDVDKLINFYKKKDRESKVVRIFDVFEGNKAIENRQENQLNWYREMAPLLHNQYKVVKRKNLLN